MKKSQLFLFLFCAQTILCAQKSIPELKQELSKANTDTTRYRLLKDLGHLYEKINRDSALFIYKTYLGLAEKNASQPDIARASYEIGTTYMYRYLNYKEALIWLEKCILIAEKGQDHDILADTYVQLGVIFGNERMIKKAKEMYLKAESHAEKTNNKRMKIFVYDALAAYYVNDEDDYKTASSYNLKALNLAEDIPELWVGLASSRCSYLTKIGDLKQVKEVHQKAMQFLKRGVYDLNDTRNLMNVLDLHGEAREYKLAEATYKELLKLVKTPRDSAILAESQYDIADYRAQQGNYKGAYEAVLEANKLQDIAELSRYTQDARVKAAETEAAFEIAQKERENLYQRRISLSIGIGLFLAIGLAFFIYRNRQNIARQKAELEDLNRTKDRLLSIIAHDLRSPIGWLKDSFDLIDNNLSTPEKTQRFLSKSKERVERVYNTMENLLVWALAQRNGLVPRFESVPIAELVEEQIQNVTDFANRKTITLKNETPQYLKVWVDRNQMGIVFNNLLQNAIKFTPSGGTVVIYAEANDSQLFTLKVADTGIGMDVEIWKTMQKSQTLLSKQGTNKEKGTGLGLFLVKEIVDKNGGLFDIQSRKNIGTIASIGLKKG